MLQYDSVIWVERILVLTKAMEKVLHDKLTNTQFTEKNSLFLYSEHLGLPLWPEFLTTDPEVPGSISGTTRFSEK
jgi:hypothetical protein